MENIVEKISSLNQLINNSVLEDKSLLREKPYSSYNTKNGRISFNGREQNQVFNDEIYYLYSKIQTVNECFAISTFSKKIVDFIASIKMEGRIATKSDIELIENYFKNLEFQKITVSREIYGIHFENGELKLGEYRLINNDYNSQFLKNFPQQWEDIEFPQYLIEIDILTKDVEKAKEIANIRFEQFENIIAYMIGDLSRKKNVKILSKIDTSSNQLFIVSPTAVTHTEQLNYSVINGIDDDFFTDEKNGNKNVWNLFSKTKNSELEIRIKNSIEWIGKALKDSNNAKTLIQFMFAIESILHIEKDKIINPSILSQISDNIAFLLSENVENRKKNAGVFKLLYNKRSGIVHGSKQSINDKDLHEALMLSKQIIKILLTTEPYKNFNNSKQLSEHLIDLKFN